jgi:hypothetical protein
LWTIKQIPGIGMITDPMIVAEFGELSRFHGGYKKFLAFAGLDPASDKVAAGTVRLK